MFREFGVKALLAVSVLILLKIAAPVLLQAETAPRIPATVDNKAVAVLPHSRHPLATPANDRGRVDANLPMQRMVMLFKPSPEQAKDLGVLLNSQQDSASPNYQRWVTPKLSQRSSAPMKLI